MIDTDLVADDVLGTPDVDSSYILAVEVPGPGFHPDLGHSMGFQLEQHPTQAEPAAPLLAGWIERVYYDWDALGRPPLHAFDLTVTPDEQTLTVPGNTEVCWRLPTTE